MASTSIEWTDCVWNPVRGCSMAAGSEAGGCLNCYAARIASRNLPNLKSPTTGEPFAVKRGAGPRWTGDVELIPRLLAEPLSWKKPRKCFVNSMSDLFHEALSFEDIAAVYGVMAACPHITFHVLTKRPERRREFFAWMDEAVREVAEAEGLKIVPAAYSHVAQVFGAEAKGGPLALHRIHEAVEWPLPNVWEGTSVENPETAARRIQFLLETPAAVRFVSYEPALEGVDFTRLEIIKPDPPFGPGAWLNALTGHLIGPDDMLPARLDWIIVGGESGPGARLFDIQWARTTVEQCKAAGVAVFVKQIGKWIAASAYGERPFCAQQWLFPDGSRWTPPLIGEHAFARPEGAIAFTQIDPKGGNWNEWPEDLRVREFPEVAHE